MGMPKGQHTSVSAHSSYLLQEAVLASIPANVQMHLSPCETEEGILQPASLAWDSNPADTKSFAARKKAYTSTFRGFFVYVYWCIA